MTHMARTPVDVPTASATDRLAAVPSQPPVEPPCRDDWTAPLRRRAESDGAFLRRDVIELGMDDRAIRRMLRLEVWVRVRHGAYTFRDLWEVADPAERHRIRMRAAMRVLRPRVVVSHHSACLFYGMPLWGVDLTPLHVTRRDGGAGRTEAGVRHHEGLLLESDIVTVGSWEVTAPERAALESASLASVESGLVTVNGGLNLGLYDAQQLAAQLELMSSWPDAQHLQVVARLADERCASAGESRSLYLFWSAGLPMPKVQYVVSDAGRTVGICDFAWPEHGLIVEFDGKEKYVKHLRPGESPADAVFREKRREDELRRVTGWRVVRLTWADLQNPVRTIRILREALGR